VNRWFLPAFPAFRRFLEIVPPAQGHPMMSGLYPSAVRECCGV
jgi:hypothetical protein